MREFIRDRDRAEPCLDGLCSIVAGTIGAAVVGAGVGIATGSAGKNAIVDSQNQIINESITARDAQVGNAQRYQDFANQQTNPFYQTGVSALNGVNAFTTPGFDLNSFLQSDPGYQAGLQGGVNAIDQGAAARGLLGSGSRLKALERYGVDYNNQKLDSLFGRYMGAAGIGQNALGQRLDAGQFATSQMNNALNYDINRRGSAYGAKGEARSDFWGGVGGSVNSLTNTFGNVLGGF